MACSTADRSVSAISWPCCRAARKASSVRGYFLAHALILDVGDRVARGDVGGAVVLVLGRERAAHDGIDPDVQARVPEQPLVFGDVQAGLVGDGYRAYR
jgi:hypothetical protein